MERCLACNSKIKLLGRNKNINIYQCPKCGLGVTESDFKLKYDAYHHDPVYIREESQFRNIFEKRVNIISKFKKSGQALEVGSSTGLLLSLLKKRGWEVLGIEPSLLSVKSARERGIPTLNTTFEQAKLFPNSFDLVIFNHVLEHMRKPVEILEKAHKVLKKDGLVFIDVPNFASLSARIRGVGWRYILPQEHLWHFTPASLFLLLEKAGFVPFYWEAYSGIWQYGSPTLELWQSFIGGKKRFFWNILTAIPTLVLTKLKAGTGLSVVAQKVK